MTCKRCGKCCHDIPLNHKEASLFKYILSLKEEHLNLEELNDSNYQYMLKGICPFLRDDNLCDIYNFRPHICRIFPLIDCEELSR